MNRIQLITINVIWLLCIGGLLIYKQMIFWTGTEILLKTAPVDPWDIFRGNYVTLNYEISTFEQPNFNTFNPNVIDQDYKDIGKTVYLILETDTKGVASAKSMTMTKPVNGELFIRGKKQYRQIEFGIESYFVPEGRGKEIEKLRGQDLMVRAVVDKDGKAVIKNLEIEGQKI